MKRGFLALTALLCITGMPTLQRLFAQVVPGVRAMSSNVLGIVKIVYR